MQLSSPSGRERGWPAPVARPALTVLLALCLLGPLAQSAAAKTPSDRDLVDVYAALEGAHVGEVLPGGPEHFIEVVDSPKYTVVLHQYGKTFTAGADTAIAWNAAGTEAVGARITIYGISHSEHGRLIRGVIAHEVFHVFEARMSGTEAISDAHAGWLEEGAAAWVESDLVSNDPTAREDWREYLGSPTTELFARSYDAIGFFGHMASSSISPWGRFKTIFKTTGSTEAWNLAVGGNSNYLDSESSAFFREPRLGSDWEQIGANVPGSKEVRAKPAAVAITGSHSVTLSAGAHRDAIYSVSIKGLPPSAPVVEVVLNSGNARIAATEGGSINEVLTSQVLLCGDPKGCSCPNRPNHYEDFQRGDIAVTGGASGGSVVLTRRKPCEVLLPPTSCENLLPGYSTQVSQGIGRVVGRPEGIGATVSKPGGSTASNCFFLTKGSYSGETFVGVIAFAGVLRAPSVAGARFYFSILAKTPGVAPVQGIGEEALFGSKSTASPTGTEYGSTGIVRVSNVVASFTLIGTPGVEEAGQAGGLALLKQVAARL